MKTIPKLRFPEFRDAPAWEEKPLNKVSPAIFDGTHQTPTYTTDGIPFFSVENIISGNKNKFISTNDYNIATSKNKPEKGDILITRIGNIGFSKVVDWDYDFSVYVTLAVVKKSKFFNSYYLHFFMQSERYQNEILRKSLLNAVPCKINMDSLRNTVVLLPKPEEQQKIADCLSSVDELITAQSTKVEALKAHKKALMQQLFPAEGETTPRLRFPEFQNAPEWEAKTIEQVCKKPYSGGTPTTSQKEYYGGAIPFIRSAEIGKDKTELFLTELGLNNSSAKIVKKGVVLVALYGANSGDVAVSKIEGAINQAILCLDSEESNEFLYHYLTLKKNWIISTYIQGGQGNLSGDIIKSIELCFPQSNEQQKIADCLSSIDELITAQSAKVEALKTHKKALMQQLFPSTSEVNQ
jgi:type I restriction enzyme S subunit